MQLTKLYIYTVFLLFPSSVIHRQLATKYLSNWIGNEGYAPTKILLVGVASDFWISNILAFAVVLLGIPPLIFGKKYFGAKLAYATGLVSVLALVLHQSYVEFFGYQITPFHLQYLNDPGAAAGNFGSLLTWKTLVISSPLLLLRPTKFFPNSRPRWYLPVFLFLTAVALHAWNIRYRVQWFVPDSLRNHWIENLYYQSLRAKQPVFVSEQELKSHLNWDYEISKNPNNHGKQLYRPQSRAAGGPFFDAIKNELTLFENSPKYLFVVLMESARAVDSGLWQKENTPSLTPTIDALGRSGLWYARAFSTGNVTRGAQEAVFCGYLSSQNTSMMRIRSDLNLPCLNEWTNIKTLKNAKLAWYHGGRGEFDSQENFWRSHDTRIGSTQKAFAETTPKTGWGVSDLSLYRYVVNDLSDKSTSNNLHISFVLSISNHIPWKLPSDAPEHIKSLSRESAPSDSHLTLAYSDWALGQFVKMLKNKNLWARSLLIVLGDHGHLEPTLKSFRGVMSKGKMLSQIPFVLSGGIVEKVRLSITTNDYPAENSKWTSQVDVAALVNWLGDTGVPNMGVFENSETRPLSSPVVADFGNEVYFPEHDYLMSEKMLLEKPIHQLSDRIKPGVVYYRAFLHWINSGADR